MQHGTAGHHVVHQLVGRDAEAVDRQLAPADVQRVALGQKRRHRALGDGRQEADVTQPQLLCLRLAVLLCHARKTPDTSTLKLAYKGSHFRLTASSDWAKRFPQSAWLLQEEEAAWQKTRWKFSVDLK